ncbi:hypothetical protein [Cellulosimicrobium sp. NPDC057862]|uniref:hypothetical protein n=1 Tax=Cellulosimicrobium sp. NPDC057862 TaxID=3346266 RepID=UPI00366E8675
MFADGVVGLLAPAVLAVYIAGTSWPRRTGVIAACLGLATWAALVGTAVSLARQGGGAVRSAVPSVHGKGARPSAAGPSGWQARDSSAWSTTARRRDRAPQAYALAVGLVAAPLLLGLVIARPRRTCAWLVATVGGALVLFVVLLVTT